MATHNIPGRARTRTTARRVIVGFLAVALLAACGSTEDAGNSSDSDNGAPVQGGTLRFALLGSPESLDPHLNTSFAASNYGTASSTS